MGFFVLVSVKRVDSHRGYRGRLSLSQCIKYHGICKLMLEKLTLSLPRVINSC